MHPFCSPEIFLAVEREQVFAPTPQEAAYIRSRMRSVLGENNPKFIAISRDIMNACEAWRFCPRRTCQRGQGCSTRLVTCMWENLEDMQTYVFPQLDDIIAERRGEKKEKYSGRG